MATLLNRTKNELLNVTTIIFLMLNIGEGKIKLIKIQNLIKLYILSFLNFYRKKHLAKKA